MPRYGVTGTQVLRYMRSRPGQVEHYSDITLGSGYGPEQGGSVSTLLARMVVKHPEYGVVRVGGERSGQYVYRAELALQTQQEPVEAPSPKLYEVVGFLPDSTTMVVRDDEQVMSLWRKIEIP